MATRRTETPMSLFDPEFGANLMRQMPTTQFEAWLRAQERFLDSFEEMTQAWVNRRRRANAATLATLRRASACSDPAEAASIYGEWLQGCMTRAMDDASSLGRPQMVFWQSLSEAAQEVAGEAPGGPRPGRAKAAGTAKAPKAEKPGAPPPGAAATSEAETPEPKRATG